MKLIAVKWCRHLKPGGYIDISELEMQLSSDDGTYHPGLDLYKYCDLIYKAANILGNSHRLPYYWNFLTSFLSCLH